MKMKLTASALYLVLTMALAGACAFPSDDVSLPPAAAPQASQMISLPQPRLKSDVSLEEALLKRRSARDYADMALSLSDISQLLWSAQGLTGESIGRTAPSAGGLYPLEVYLVAGKVDDLAAGVYKYQPQGHTLIKVKDGDVRGELSGAALNQAWVKRGAAVMVIAAVYEKTTVKYGERGIRYVHMEAGHAAQNICLQATALNLGAVTVGAFNDGQMKTVLGMPDSEAPLYVIPVGRKP